MSDYLTSEALIHALVDHELTPSEFEHVQQLIAGDPKLAQLHQQLQQQRSLFEQLPVYEPPSDLAARISAAVPAETGNQVTLQSSSSTAEPQWQNYAGVGAILAAAVMLLVGVYHYGKGVGARQTAVAQAEKMQPASTFTETANSSPATPVARLDLDKSPAAEAGDSPIVSKDSTGSSTLTQKTQQDNRPVSPADAQLASSPAKENRGASTVDAVNSNPLASGDAALAVRPEHAELVSAQTPQDRSIEQVWVLNVGKSFTQEDFVGILLANEIEVPAKLREKGRDDLPIVGAVDAGMGGVYIAAKPSQMKQAMADLASFDLQTVSVLQLPPNQNSIEAIVGGIDGPAISDPKAAAGVDPDAAASGRGVPKVATLTKRRSMAQQLKGFHFQPSPVSKLPRTFEELEAQIARRRQVAKDPSESPIRPDPALAPESLENYLILIQAK